MVAVLSGCLVHLFLPGFTPDRPRDMTLMYRETEGEEQGHIVLESIHRRPNMHYARSHDFRLMELNDGRLGTVTRPARAVAALQLPGATVNNQEIIRTGDGWRRRLQLELPPGTPLVQLTLPGAAGLQKAWINGVLALDTSLETKHRGPRHAVRVIHPPSGALDIEISTTAGAALSAAVLTWHELPGLLTAPFMGNWPDAAQPAQLGPRAEKVQQLRLIGEP